MNLVYLGVGSNIEPEKNILRSLQLLSQHVMIVSVSSLWHTMPIGTDSPPFMNAAILIETNFDLNYLKEVFFVSLKEKMEGFGHWIKISKTGKGWGGERGKTWWYAEE